MTANKNISRPFKKSFGRDLYEQQRDKENPMSRFIDPKGVGKGMRMRTKHPKGAV